MPRGEIAYSLLNSTRIRFDLNMKKYQAIIETFIQPATQARATIAGGCFTVYPTETSQTIEKSIVDLYISTSHKDTMHSQLNNDGKQMAAMLAEVNNTLTNHVDSIVVGDSFNRNVICQTTQTHDVSWLDENNTQVTKLITVKILFTVQEMNRIDSLLNMFQLEPCKMAYKDKKFHFSDWFVRGGSIISEGHEPSVEFINKYLEKGFEHSMNTGWQTFCNDFNRMIN